MEINQQMIQEPAKINNLKMSKNQTNLLLILTIMEMSRKKTKMATS